MGEKRLQTTFGTRASIGFTQGKFDGWCVEVTSPGIPQYPTDEWYFTKLVEYARVLGAERVYKDFVTMYDMTTKDFDTHTVRAVVDMVSDEYPSDARLVFLILYYGMVAEENKANTKLGKRIKRLGVHELLVYGDPPHIAAHSTRGNIWQAIQDKCREAGF